jgi:hypothetical protein
MPRLKLPAELWAGIATARRRLKLEALFGAGFLSRGIDVAISGEDLRWHFKSRHCYRNSRRGFALAF